MSAQSDGANTNPPASPPTSSPMVFGHYGQASGSSSNWKAAFFTSSAVYVALGVIAIAIGTATTKLVKEPPPPVEVTFVEKVARPEPPPPPVVAPKPLPKLPPVTAKAPRPAAAAAAPVPKNMKVRKVDAPPKPKQLLAPEEMPQEAPKEVDASLDKGVAVYGEPGEYDPAGLEGSGGDGAGDMYGFDLPQGAVAPKPYRTNRRPPYPPSAIEERRVGVVKIRCVVMADGWLDDIEIVSGDEPFVSETRKALRRWRYEPAQLEGQRIAVPHIIELRFKLNT